VSSKCIEKLPHRTDKCNSSDGLQVFLEADGRYTGYCFKCGTRVESPYGDKPEGYKPKVSIKSDEEIQAELDEVKEYQTVDLPKRKLRKETLEYFGIKIGMSETDGVTPRSCYFPYYKNGKLIGYKVKLIDEKKMWAIGSTKESDFFGWNQAILAGGKKLFCVEGEEDCVALFQIFKDKNKSTQYADLNPAIVSISNGSAGAAKQISRMLPEIRKQFKEVVLVFDNDEAGKKAVEEVLKILPDALVASIPSKDANQALIDGRSIATYNACQFNAQKPKNTRLIYASSLHEAAKERPKMGFSWPWSHLTKATRGIRFGETIYLGAPQKMGKSDVVNTLAAHFIKEHGWNVFLIKPEEENKRTYKMVAGKLVGKFFHDPNKEFDEDSFEEAGAIIQDNLILLNLYQAVDWETTKTDIRAAVAEGVKAVFLDPLTNYSNGMSAADANVLLQKIAQEAAALALDLNIVMFLTCHVRNPESGIPHELGGHVLSNQMAGSRAMARSCHLLLGLEGNRDPNLPAEERNMRQIVILEDRNFGENGRFKLYWDNNTGLFQEINH